VATLLTMRSGPSADKVCVARIGAAHGVRGEVKLWSFTHDPAAVASYGPLETQDGTRRFEIEALRPAKDHFVARIAGVASRDAAEQLRNLELYIPRARLPHIEEVDTFYHADLVGLDAVTPEGTQVGTVHALHNFGAGDIIEIMPLGSGEPLMLPFNETTVPKIDLEAKQIVIVPPTEIEAQDN
jgi:16S rRNA processing protein RimM